MTTTVSYLHSSYHVSTLFRASGVLFPFYDRPGAVRMIFILTFQSRNEDADRGNNLPRAT